MIAQLVRIGRRSGGGETGLRDYTGKEKTGEQRYKKNSDQIVVLYVLHRTNKDSMCCATKIRFRN
jgi:hypothetical protein